MVDQPVNPDSDDGEEPIEATEPPEGANTEPRTAPVEDDTVPEDGEE